MNQTTETKQGDPDVSRGKYYRVVNLKASNIKKLKAVDITPEDDLVLIAGDNGEGKTSALDAITYALGGKDAVDKEPIRKGQHRAEVQLDCGDFVVRRIITSTAQKLELKAKNGDKIEQPQTFLNRIIGRLSFDPLEFADMKARDRVDTLLDLTGLKEPLEEIATRRNTVFAERTKANHLLRNAEGELEEMDAPEPDAPTELVNTDELLKEKNFRQAEINGNEGQRQALREQAAEGRRIKARIDALKSELAQAEEEYEKALAVNDKLRHAVNALVDPDLSEIDTKIAAATETNAKATHAKAYQEKLRKMNAADAEVQKLTDQINAIDREKKDILEATQFPVKGLAFSADDDEVSFNGVLFDQLSGAEQLRVSLAMAMAMNPAMRVIRITNGSLLDNRSMDIIRQMAKQTGYQVWIEVVGARDDATVIIEDGQVKEAEGVSDA
jgi:DNA repair ATPase RecN